MPDNISSIVIMCLFFGIGALALIGGIVRFIKNRYTPIKTVRATVVDKHIMESFSKYSGDGKRRKYVIVFSFDSKKKSFCVSQFSYNGYRIKETGQLTYRGDKIIDFR